MKAAKTKNGKEKDRGTRALYRKRTKEKKRKKETGNCHKIAEIGVSHRLAFIGLWKMYLYYFSFSFNLVFIAM